MLNNFAIVVSSSPRINEINTKFEVFIYIFFNMNKALIIQGTYTMTYIYKRIINICPHEIVIINFNLQRM